MFRQSGTNEASPNSRQEDPTFLFLHFPSPFLDNSDPLFVPQQDEIIDSHRTDREIHMEGSKKPPRFCLKRKKRTDDGAKNPNPRKRSGKTDRHSKIYTANGPRDRRMRLSVQIARKFFDLQDMLGFDKASKTIEWLFSNSKAAIRELTGNLPQLNYNCGRHGKSVSSSLECEIAIKEDTKEIERKGEIETLMVAADHNEKKSRKWRKGACDNRRAKESRDMARARARARTREKMIIRSLEKAKQCLDLDLEANTNNLEQLGSLSPFERVYGLHAQSLEKNSPLELLSHIEEPRLNSIEHQLATVGIIENFLGIASSSSTSQSQSQSQSIFDFQLIPAVSDGVDSNSFVGIRGNWDMEDARINSNYCALTTGNVHEQNPSPTSNIHSHFQGSHFSYRPLDGNDSYSLN
ncbi:hypothetical protein CsSME_00022321 [Camellia sinensis var. sinensis]